jgi:signal peptidase I
LRKIKSNERTTAPPGRDRIRPPRGEVNCEGANFFGIPAVGWRLVTVGAMALILLLAAVVPWARIWQHSLADPKPAATAASSLWVVSGPSMVPTLMGPSAAAQCVACQLICRIEAGAIDAGPDKVLCSHCGRPLQIDRPADPQNRAAVNADIVTVVAKGRAEISARGSLIAATRDQSPWFVKRLIGLPGDVVGVHQDGMHLTLNGRRIEDVLVQMDDRFPLPRFLVDDDNSRQQSRWSSLGGDTGTSWQRDAQRQWHTGNDADGAWLVYSHASVYDQDRPSPVLDDYQYNVTLTRKLQPVDRFSFAGRCECSGTAKLQVAFWSANQTSIASLEVDGGQEFATSFHQATIEGGLPVSPTQPVAVRVTGKSVVLSSLKIHRLIEYRLRPRDELTQYPLRIDAGEVFVLGDNVPVSVDSRDFGSLAIDDVIGIVSKVSN